MSNATDEYPDLSTVYPAPTAPPPNPTQSEYPTLEEAYGPSSMSMPSQPSQGILGAVGEALKAQPGIMKDALTNPITQAKALPILAGVVSPMVGIPSSVGVAGGNALADAALASYGRSDQIPSVTSQIAQTVGAGAADLAGPIASFFKTPESLKSAGITASTLEHMAPGGQNPADYAKAVENQLAEKGIISNTAKETWDLMNKETQKVGQTIGQTLQKIKSSASGISQQFGGIEDPTVVDAQPVLKPLADQIQKMGQGIYSATQAAATPFQQAYDGLMKIAQSQGGKLTLDNVDPVLKETGAMMDQGGEAQSIYGKVYGKLADVRDSMVNTIAQQAGNPELAQTLLKNNADYSTYMRLMPSVEKSAYREAVKEGVSAYQKHIGPLGEKMAIAGGTYAAVRAAMDKVLGTGQ